MLEQWDQLKDEIKKETNQILTGKLSHSNDELLELFKKLLLFPLNNQSLRLDGLAPRVFNAMNKLLLQGGSKIENHSFFPELAKIEPCLRKILYLLDRPKYSQLSSQNKGLNAFISALNLNSGNVRLSGTDPSTYLNDPQLTDHLLIVYQLRNIESHQCAEWTNAQLYNNIQSVLSIYLMILDKHYTQLSSLINEYFEIEVKDFSKHLVEIQNSFTNKINRYIHIQGKENYRLTESIVIEQSVSKDLEEEPVERKGTIAELRATNIPEKRMLIWGDAGLGKTTSLEYLAYIDADYRIKTSDGPIPVYLALGLLTDKTVSIKQAIFNKLNVDVAYGEKMLVDGNINLFLDAVNEIPKDENFSLRTIRNKEIQQLINQYPNTFIIVSNRPQDINEFKGIPVFVLQKLDIDQIKLFIQKNTVDFAFVADKINAELDNDDRLHKIISTPLMLSRLIEIVRTQGEIFKSEGEIIHQFLHSLYTRERLEKKDANFDIKKIHRLLRYLGYSSLEKKDTNAGMSEDEVLNYFVECKQKFGFEIDTIYVLETVTQLNILEKNETLYAFAHQAYQDYYHAQEERAKASI